MSPQKLPRSEEEVWDDVDDVTLRVLTHLWIQPLMRSSLGGITRHDGNRRWGLVEGSETQRHDLGDYIWSLPLLLWLFPWFSASWLTRGEQLSSTTCSHHDGSVTRGWKAGKQLTMDWNPSNHEPKQIFLPLSCFSQVLCHSNVQLTLGASVNTGLSVKCIWNQQLNERRVQASNANSTPFDEYLLCIKCHVYDLNYPAEKVTSLAL